MRGGPRAGSENFVAHLADWAEKDRNALLRRFNSYFRTKEGRMKRRIHGLHEADRSAADSISDGLFLVRADRAQYLWQRQKPYYLLRFTVLEPNQRPGA